MPVTTRAVSRCPPSFVPEQRLDSGFDDIHTLSTFHQRFTHVRLFSAHLTGLSRLFLNAHYPGHCAGAASGGLDPGPAARVRGANPHLPCSSAAFRWPCRPPFRAFVAHSHRRNAPLSPSRGTPVHRRRAPLGAPSPPAALGPSR